MSKHVLNTRLPGARGEGGRECVASNLGPDGAAKARCGLSHEEPQRDSEPGGFRRAAADGSSR